MWPVLLTIREIDPDSPMRGLSRSRIVSPVIGLHLHYRYDQDAPKPGARRIERAAFWTGSKLAAGCSKPAGGCSPRGREVYRASNCSVVARARGSTIRSALALSVGEYLARYA